jgi:S-adenosylmethionine:tRNA ribosyltransferase-isomerase
MQGHNMHEEQVQISLDFVKQLLQHKGPVVAVGTTTLRTLESLYWFGVQCLQAGNETTFAIDQWLPYNHPSMVSKNEALQAAIQWCETNQQQAISGKTALMVAPGYEARLAQGLITNFHQPQSTLLLLIAALVGNDWKKIYEIALQHHYRFLSYGDANLYWIGKPMELPANGAE